MVWHDKGIPAKFSQSSFGTTKAVKCIFSQFKYIFISPKIGKYNCPSAWFACWVASNIGMPPDLQIDSVIREAVAPVSNVTFNYLFIK